jgi:hypothetical protein
VSRSTINSVVAAALWSATAPEGVETTIQGPLAETPWPPPCWRFRGQLEARDR